jgi:hypothetical protein
MVADHAIARWTSMPRTEDGGELLVDRGAVSGLVAQ